MTPHLFKPPAPVPANLTPRQTLAWDYIRSVPGGVTADELGAHLHSLSDTRPHPDDQRCPWCARTGKDVAGSTALKPLVIRRHTSRYEPRDPKWRASEPSTQLVELPGETFEDLFGEAA